MWVYVQRSGALMDATGKVVWYGYSGKGPGKNNPDDHFKFEGPCPCGLFTIEHPQHVEPQPPGDHGPYTLALTPDPKNEMFGRDGFLLHGDSKSAPGTASQGCIILPRPIRETVWNSGDHLLRVVAEPDDAVS